MNDLLGSTWFQWAVTVAIGTPVLLIALTELQRTLRRRQSPLVRPVSLLRNYLVPLGALLVLLLHVTQASPSATVLRMLATLLAFGAMLFLLSVIKAILFQSAHEESWRNRVPSIFIDLVRALLIAIGIALIASHVWGANIKGIFTALGVTSIIAGLILQNSVGQVVTGLLMLFEQPFKLGDWINAPMAQGRVLEVNWRAVHLAGPTGIQIVPNSVLAAAPFVNLSRPPGGHILSVDMIFSLDDPPDAVCAMLTRTAVDLPGRNPDFTPAAAPLGLNSYRTEIHLLSPNDDQWVKAVFLRWVWYAARREHLRFNDVGDSFQTQERLTEAVHDVVAPTLRITDEQFGDVCAQTTLVRYGAGETIARSGEIPDHMAFLVSGMVRLTTRGGAGQELPIGVLERGAFLNQTVLTRQPVIGSAYAVDEVTLACVNRECIQTLVAGNPLLLEELGRAIESRRELALAILDEGADSNDIGADSSSGPLPSGRLHGGSG